MVLSISSVLQKGGFKYEKHKWQLDASFVLKLPQVWTLHVISLGQVPMRLHFLRGSPKSPGLLERGRDSFFRSFSSDVRSTPRVENEKAISIKRENYMVLDFFTPLEQFLPE